MDWSGRSFGRWERDGGLWLPDGGRRGRLPWPSTTPVPALGRGARPSSLIAVSDSFDRADSATALGKAITGQSYTVHAGTAGISTNRAYFATAADGNRATLDSAKVDGRFQIKVLCNAYATRDPQFIFRGIDATNFLLLDVGTTLKFYKSDDNVFTQLASVAVTFTNNTWYWIAAVCSGDSVVAYTSTDGVTWTQRITYSLTAGEAKYKGATATRLGFRQGGNGAGIFFDDLQARAA